METNRIKCHEVTIFSVSISLSLWNRSSIYLGLLETIGELPKLCVKIRPDSCCSPMMSTSGLSGHPIRTMGVATTERWERAHPPISGLLLWNRAPNVKIKLGVAVEQRDTVREVHLFLDEPCAAVSSWPIADTDSVLLCATVQSWKPCYSAYFRNIIELPH